MFDDFAVETIKPAGIWDIELPCLITRGDMFHSARLD
jgi:hypothetical protein